MRTPNFGINRICALVFQKGAEQKETNGQSLAINAKHITYERFCAFTPYDYIISTEKFHSVKFRGLFSLVMLNAALSIFSWNCSQIWCTIELTNFILFFGLLQEVSVASS